MNFTGKNLINGEWVAEGSVTFSAFNPTNSAELSTFFTEATKDEVEKVCAFSENSFQEFQSFSPGQHFTFIHSIVEEIHLNSEALIHYFELETGLGKARAKVELQRTIYQFESYLASYKKGWAQNCIIETGEESFGVDLRKMNVPLGPILVFGASNFPFAYSTLGGDVASALIAGCSVIVKAHPMHPHVAELSAQVILNALLKAKVPLGMFQQINAESFAISEQLVKNDVIKAIGFTGSVKGGEAILDYVHDRKEPIPVFAEMGSTNPIFVYQNALKTSGEEIATKIVDSFTLGAGQFCTSPGILVLQKSELTNDFISRIVDLTKKVAPQRMLHPRILENYVRQIEKRSHLTEIIVQSSYDVLNFTAQIEQITSSQFLKSEELKEEVFGSYLLLVICEAESEFKEILKAISGQLTISVFSDEKIDLMEFINKTGRIIFNNVPTGVTVSEAMQHGGPYPSSSRSDTSSVGPQAIQRFMRSVSLQSFPENQLPNALKVGDNLGFFQKVNGNWQN